MILDFLLQNWRDIITVILLGVLSLLPIFPPYTVGFQDEYYDIYQKKMMKQKWFNFIELVPTIVFITFFKGIVVSMGSKGTITLILFVFLGTDLFINKSLTNNDVAVSIVAIIALYLEKMLDSAEEISFWKIFTWKAKKG